MSTSSTPWFPAAKLSRISMSAALTAAAPDSGSRVSNSSTGSGRAAANSAASSSWASGLTADLDGRERPVLAHGESTPFRQLEQRDEGRQHVHERGPLPDHVPPPEGLPLAEQALDSRGGALDVERPRD